MRRPFAAPAAVLAAGLLAPLLALVPPAASASASAALLARPAATAAAATRSIQLRRFDSPAQLRTGTVSGVRVTDQGRVAFVRATSTRSYDGKKYDAARWTSPWVSPGFSFTNLIPSWSAVTPGDSWVEVRVRGRASGGTVTSWDGMARWTSGDAWTHRASGAGQSDDGTTVDVDTWRTAGLASYQVAVTLHRRVGTSAVPTLDLVTAMASRLPPSAGATSTPGAASGKALDVPRYSQMTHRGHYPAWGSGGEAWCSPTSTSMVLGYYGRRPAPSSYSWVPSGHPDPWVDHAARSTYDYAYDGTGNWPFNTAYAAPLAGKAFVTRLRNLREAERFILAGIPLVVSIAFGPGELDNAPISSSDGHLLVVSGFTRAGNVIVNDPASSTRDGVRRWYPRAQLERLWLEASGGLTYVIHDAAHPLPTPAGGNW